jgi:hypothetical protein
MSSGLSARIALRRRRAGGEALLEVWLLSLFEDGRPNCLRETRVVSSAEIGLMA